MREAMMRATAGGAAGRGVARRARERAAAVVIAVRLALLSALCAALIAGAAAAVQPEERLADPLLEERARDISKGLRCVVCQNQSIDDSDAVIAGDMRRLVRERLVAGDSDDEIRDLMVSYYGEFVLLAPRLSWTNAALWAAAPLALLLGGFWVWRKTRAAAPAAAGAGAGAHDVVVPPPLSAEEQKRLDELLGRPAEKPSADS